LDIDALLLKGKEADEAEARAKRQKIEVEIGLDDPSKDFKRMIDNEENSWKPGPPTPLQRH